MTTPTPKDETADALRDNRFWLIVHEPGLVPVRKGPWNSTEMAQVMREFIAAKPTAYLHVLTTGYDGPWVDHGPEALQMLDGRSMGVGRKHNERTKAAHLAALSDRAAEPTGRLVCMTHAAFDRLVADKSEAIAEVTTLRIDRAALSRRLEAVEGALRWYAEQVGHVRNNHSEGGAARQALDKDCGERARAALATTGGAK